MKKLIKSLLLLALVTSNINAATNKTFLLPRSQGVNLPMEYTTWNELLRIKDEDKFGANFQITGFYQDSAEKSDIGKYFGVKGKNYFVGNSGNTTDIKASYLIHDGGFVGTIAGAYNALTSQDFIKFKLEPEQTVYGVRINYFQQLNKLLKGLYLKVTFPIVNVKNDPRLRVEGISVTNADTSVIESKYRDYFNGNFSWTDVGHSPITTQANATTFVRQDALQYGLISGKNSRTGVADLDLTLGYNIFDKEKYFVGVNLGLTIPTGNDADGRHMFEAMIGNGDHWGFGAGFWAGLTLWKKNSQNIKISTALDYRYLFENTERRTLGIDGYDWGQYVLLGEIGTNVAGGPTRSDISFKPAANLLNQSVKVKIGSQLDAIINLAYNRGGLSVDLGYNLFWKDRESVKRRDFWQDNKYGILYVNQPSGANAGVDFFTYSAAPVNINTAGGGGAEAYLNNATDSGAHAVGITTKPAESPSQTTNKIYGGVGYMFRDWEYPLMLGIGAAYEFADNNAIENWQLWGKVGVAF